MLTDVEIAQNAKPRHIRDVAAEIALDSPAPRSSWRSIPEEELARRAEAPTAERP